MRQIIISFYKKTSISPESLNQSIRTLVKTPSLWSPTAQFGNVAVGLVSQVSHLRDLMSYFCNRGNDWNPDCRENSHLISAVWFCLKRKTTRCLSTNRESSSCGRTSDQVSHKMTAYTTLYLAKQLTLVDSLSACFPGRVANDCC